MQQPDAVEHLEARLLEQESEITNVENRSSFAMYCLQMETQLVFASVEGLLAALRNLTEDERFASSEVSEAFVFVRVPTRISCYLSCGL